MKKLNADLGDLELAFSSNNPEMPAYFDTETGKTHFVDASLLNDVEEDADDCVRPGGWGRSAEDIELARQIVEGFGTRFYRVPGQSSHEGYRDMERFIDSVEDEHLRELLEVAIDGSGAFRRFKDVLSRHPNQRQQWFDFQSERERHRILEWLEFIGITPMDAGEEHQQ